jgi:hypothetical protein
LNSYVVVFVNIYDYVVIIDGSGRRALQADSTRSWSTLLVCLHVTLTKTAAISDGYGRIRETLVA